MVAGLALAVKAGGGLLLLGLAGAVLIWAYTGPPLRLGERGTAEVIAALAWWLVVLGADFVQRHHFFMIPAVDAASFALLVAAITLAQRAVPINPAAAPKPQWHLVLGAAYAALVLLAYGWLAGGVALLYQPHQALWGMVSLPVSLAAAGLLWRTAQQPQCALLAWRLTVAAVLLHGLSMAGGLITVSMV